MITNKMVSIKQLYDPYKQNLNDSKSSTNLHKHLSKITWGRYFLLS